LDGLVNFLERCLSIPQIKIILTSRPFPSQFQYLLRLEKALVLEIAAEDSDVRNFLVARTRKQNIDPKLKSELIEKVAVGVDGM
jgi:hypothetical protein